MREHKIGLREGVCLGTIFVGSTIFLQFPRTVAQLGGTAGWLIVLLGCALAPVGAWLLIGLLKKFPGLTLLDCSEKVFGVIGGTLLNCIYMVTFLYMTTVVLREFAENIIVSILPNTPIEFVLLCILLAIAAMARTGVEGMGRVSSLFFPLICASIVLFALGGMLTYKAQNALAPFWGTGPREVVKWGASRVSLFTELLIFGLLAPNFRELKQLKKSLWLTLVFSSAAFLMIIVVYSYIFPYPASARITFPFMEISRLISLGRWVQRLESVFLLVWLFCAVIKLALGLFAAARSLSHVIRLPEHKPLIFPLAVMVYGASLLPPSLTDAVNLDRQLRTYGWIVWIAAPLLTWGAYWIRRGVRSL